MAMVKDPVKVSVKNASVTTSASGTGTSQLKTTAGAIYKLKNGQVKPTITKSSTPLNKGGSGGGGSSGGGSAGGSGGGGSAYVEGNIGNSAAANTLIGWNGVSFFANASQVVGFNGLTITGKCETENQAGEGEKYQALKYKEGFEISLTAIFDRRLGISDVQADAIGLAEKACNGEDGYIYSRGKKLVTPVMMATSGKVQNILMTPGGIWIHAEVAMTFKSCTKLDGTYITVFDADDSSDGSGGGGGGSDGSDGSGSGTTFFDKAKQLVYGDGKRAAAVKSAVGVLNKIGSVISTVNAAKKNPANDINSLSNKVQQKNTR